MKYNFTGFTEKANEALNQAINSAQLLGHTYVGSEHLLLGLLRVGSGVAATVLNNNGITAENIEQQLKNTIGSGTPTRLSPDYFTPRAKRVIETAITGCNNLGKKYVGTEHLLIAILSEGDNYAVRFIGELGVDAATVTAQALKAAGIEPEEMQGNSNTDINDGKKGDKSSMLRKFGRDLTAEAKKGKIDPVIGRSAEIERVIQILCRRTKNNPCLIGEPGVGKTAIIEGLAQKIISGDVPEILQDKKLFTLDLTGMVAGTKYRGDFEERIKGVIEEVTKSNDIILFIDEIHTIIGAGSAEGSTDAANILKPSLARGDFQLIGATTISEYRKNIEKDSALERRFQPVTVNEPSEEDAVLILKGLRDKYEAHHKVAITDEAIEAAVTLSARYINDRFLPDKAIDLIDEAASKIRLSVGAAPDSLKDLEEKISAIAAEKDDAINSQEFERAANLRDEEKRLIELRDTQKNDWKNNRTTGSVTGETIAEIVSSWTGVPVVQLTEEESERLLKLEGVLHERLVGQHEAVTAIAKAIRRGRVGLKDPKRPIGSFIFLGPTGVGKTELCKALAEAMFGSENMMIRLDMSEYMEKHTVSRLVGSPPGYVGFEEGGQLPEKVRRQPYSVVLFDEIEKAHPDVFNILLQILEDGILTDSQGRRVDFKNTVIIMTSNIGARLITEKKVSFGFGDNNDGVDNADIKEKVLGELKSAFRPEFLNRVDDTIVFTKLSSEEIKQIAAKMLENLKKRLLNLNIKAEFTDNTLSRLAEKGFDAIYGARPLRREIQNSIEDALSEKILDGSVKNGDTVICDYEGESFTFNTK
ncbi:MAG: ATP-dependent Clp protease ATP-binding subunit [Acutalibacteraceae bacterium]|nr:ATP-dependent Clp protease ATP-binding subunit [Acutalibacteraceae bacterium]